MIYLCSGYPVQSHFYPALVSYLATSQGNIDVIMNTFQELTKITLLSSTILVLQIKYNDMSEK